MVIIEFKLLLLSIIMDYNGLSLIIIEFQLLFLLLWIINDYNGISITIIMDARGLAWIIMDSLFKLTTHYYY